MKAVWSKNQSWRLKNTSIRAVTFDVGGTLIARAAHELGVEPGGILHVGDSRIEDYEGAQAVGRQSLWLRRSEAASENCIQSLRQITSQIGN